MAVSNRPADRDAAKTSEARLPGPRRISSRELVAVASAAAAAAVFTTTAAPGRPLFARPGDVDGEFTPVQRFTVQCLNGLLRLLGGAHGDESKTPRTAAGAVHHQVGFDDRAVRSERILQGV